MEINWFNSEKYFFHWFNQWKLTDLSVKRQITNSISENLTDSDLESMLRENSLNPFNSHQWSLKVIYNIRYSPRQNAIIEYFIEEERISDSLRIRNCNIFKFSRNYTLLPSLRWSDKWSVAETTKIECSVHKRRFNFSLCLPKSLN